MYDEFSNSFTITTNPIFETTTFELYFAKTRQGECPVDPDHKYVTVSVGGGGGGGLVTTEFNLPNSTCPYSDPINLRNWFTTNVTGGTITFYGDGVDGNTFYPSSVSSGSHAITAKLTYNGQEYSTTKYIYVYERVSLWLPETVLISSQPLVLSGGTPYGGTYSCSTAPQAVVGNMFYPSIAGTGEHQIVYTYNGVCGGVATARIRVTAGTGVEESLDTLELSVYPNPTDGVVNFSIPDNVKITAIRIVSLTGRIIRTLDAIGNTTIDLSDLPSGTYGLLICTEDNNLIRKIVSKH